MKGYDYIYWCFYNLVWKQKKDVSQERAAALLASLIALLLYAAFFLLRIALDFKSYEIVIESIVVLLIGLSIIVFHVWHYGKSGKYKELDKYFIFKGYSRGFAKGLAIGFIFFAYGFFVFSGIILGRYLNPW
jgi:high-affinity Fe2+/Pb2+ permease